MPPARDALLHVPPRLPAESGAPLVVMLHGAGSSGRAALVAPLLAWADAAGAALLAPDSRGPTWDAMLGGFGPDVDFLGEALGRAFGSVAVDPARVALAGFSDGASYALSLGVGNGDLFSHLIAFSPGFLAPAESVGMPAVFVAHGTRDAVLPIDGASRQIVPILRMAGYGVTYEEFEGGHAMPADVVARAAGWFMSGVRAR